MAKTRFRRTSIATGCGTPGRQGSRGLAKDCFELGIGDTLAAYDCPDFNRRLETALPKLNLQGVVDLSVPVEQIEEADGFTGNHRLTIAKRPSWHPAVVAANDAHLRAVAAHNLKDPFCFFAWGYSGGHLPVTVDLLADLCDRAVPGEMRLGYALLSHEQALRDITRDNPWIGARLKDARFLEVTILVDNRSAVDLAFGRPFKDALNVRAIAGLMTSSWQWANARAAADVTAHIGRYGAFAGISHGLEHLPIESESPRWFRGVRRVTGDTARGMTEVDTIVRLARSACLTAITNPAWRTVEDGPSLDLPAYLVICLPKRRGRPKDDSEWREIKARVEDWLATEYPAISILWVVAPGIAHPEEGRETPYHLQASLFYVLPEEPLAIRKILNQPNLKRRPRGVRLESLLEEPADADEVTPEPRRRPQLQASMRHNANVSPTLALNGSRPDRGGK